MNEQIQELLKKQPIVLIDGECGFCNRTVMFILRYERNQKLHFASLQSEIGIMLRKYFEIDDSVDSIIFIRDHSAFIKSCAVLRLCYYLKGLWPIFNVLIIIPPFMRNWVYEIVAARRMKIYGRVERCALLTKEQKKRFLDINN